MTEVIGKVKCSVCGKEIPNWYRRENEMYCGPCYRGALRRNTSLSTHSNEEANLRVSLREIAGKN